MIRNTQTSYGSGTKLLHWTMALLALGMLCAGFYMVGLDMGTDKLKIYNLHKSVGATVLALAVLRVLWHLATGRPALIASLKTWEKAAARTVHLLLYTCILLQPLSGWLMSSAAGRPVQVFDLFTLPDLVGQDMAKFRLLLALHYWNARTLCVLIALHAAAALKHHFIDKDRTLLRMLPFTRGE